MKHETNVIAIIAVAEVCSFEMVNDITIIYQQTVCFFTADLAFGFRLKQ
jgi:hypothetical protein